MERVNCAGGIVVNSARQVLVVANAIGTHTFPKGAVKEGESSINAALREIEEESGLNLRGRTALYLGVLVRPGLTEDNATPSVTKHIQMFHWYAGREIDLAPAAPDVVGAQWIQSNDVANTLSWPQERDFFEQHRRALNL